MKKETIWKLLIMVIAAIAFLFAQHYIRLELNIDPRKWFFVVFAVCVFVFGLILFILMSDERMEKRFDKMTEALGPFPMEKPYHKKFSKREKTRLFLQYVTNSGLYNLAMLVVVISNMVGLWYKIFFEEDFLTRTIPYAVFLLTIAILCGDRIVKAIIGGKKKRTFRIVYAGLWAMIFCVSLAEFVA